MSFPKRLTLPQAARLAHRSEESLRDGIAKGRLRASQPNGPGTRIYITEADLEAWLNAPVEDLSEGRSDLLPGGGRVVPGSVPVRFPDAEDEVLASGARIHSEVQPVRFPDDEF